MTQNLLTLTLIMPEERETPGLTSRKLQMLCQGLTSLLDVIAHEDSVDTKRASIDAMVLILGMIKERLEGSRVEDAPRPNITVGGDLLLKPIDAIVEQAKKVEAGGRNEAWSSANLYGRLEHLQTLAYNVGRRCSIVRH